MLATPRRVKQPRPSEADRRNRDHFSDDQFFGSEAYKSVHRGFGSALANFSVDQKRTFETQKLPFRERKTVGSEGTGFETIATAVMSYDADYPVFRG